MVTRRVGENFHGDLANASGYQYNAQLQKPICPTAFVCWLSLLDCRGILDDTRFCSPAYDKNEHCDV